MGGCGSIAIAAQARSVMLVGKDHPSPGTRVLAMVKTNLPAMSQSRNFQIAEQPAAAIKWLGPSDLSADDLVRRASADDDLHPAIQAASIS